MLMTYLLVCKDPFLNLFFATYGFLLDICHEELAAEKNISHSLHDYDPEALIKG